MSAVSSEPAPRIDHARRAESGPGGAEITADYDPSMLKGRAAAPAGQARRTSKVKEGTDDESARWKDTLEKVIKSLVSIRFIVTRNFDTWQVGSYTATGFIVDVEEGLILTNKHVVTDAPFIGKVCFKNSEEVAAWPAWRDPIHDFGFLRFDKSKVKFMDLHAVPLAPEAARVGLAVRVPGSDAGEKLAVLSGIIARIDRPTANYGTGTYCDFNTFYIQASANTSGGSSGSPVIDIEGRAVALNAGGSMHAASSFFLPLWRVNRALELLKEGKYPSRGTLQVEFVQKQYDECRRLGLPLEVEEMFRAKNPELNGILAVKHTIPGGPGDGLLHTGDILVKMEGKLIHDFVELAQILDDKAGPIEEMMARGEKVRDEDKPFVTLTVFRNKEFVELDCTVDSLHAITPDRYVEIGGSIVHPLSYQLARSYLHPCGGVFVADAGHMLGVAGIPAYSIITSVAHKRTPNIETFIEVMRELATGTRVPVRYYSLAKKNVEIVKICVVENRWGRFRMAVRDDPAGIWTYSDLPSSNATLTPAIRTASYIHINPAKNKHSLIASRVMPSLCVVECHAPFGIDGHNSKWSDGVGIIIDAELGLVLVDRSTVPTALGRLFVTFANNLVAPGKIVWMHPIWNVVVVRYDVEFLNAAKGAGQGQKANLPVKSVEFSPLPGLVSGDEVNLVTINVITHIPRVQTTHVKSKGYFMFGDTSPPKIRTINWDDAVSLQKPMCEEAGVIADEEGRVRGAWLVSPESNSYLGLGLQNGGMVKEAIEAIRARERGRAYNAAPGEGKGLPIMRVADVELTETYFWKARELGLSEEWIDRITQARADQLKNEVDAPPTVQRSEEVGGVVGGDKYTVITVRRIPATSVRGDDPDDKLKEGDLILASNGKPVTQMQGDLMHFIYPESATAARQEAAPLELTILREGQEMTLTVPRIHLSGAPNVDVVQWGGAIFQMPHRTLSFHVKRLPKGVYISLLYSGSPAQRDHLSACWFVVEVDGKRTTNLDEFLSAVEGPDWASRVPLVNPISEGWQADSLSTVRSQQEDAPQAGTPTSAAGDSDETEEDLTKAKDGRVIKTAVSRSFRIRLVSLEQVQKVVTVDMDLGSKNYWPTWRCVVKG